MINNPAYSQIKKYGAKGRAVLKNGIPTKDILNLSQSVLYTDIELYCWVGRNPSAKTDISNDRRTSVRALVLLDDDFDGVVNDSSKLVVDGRTLDVANHISHTVNGEIYYVEIFADG